MGCSVISFYNFFGDMYHVPVFLLLSMVLLCFYWKGERINIKIGAQHDSERSAYLLPEYEDDNQMEYLLEKYFKPIFEEQLNGWWQDTDAWPPRRDLKTFKEWFDVEFHSVVFDLVDKPIQTVE